MLNTLGAILDTKGRSIHSVRPDATVLEAVRTMNAHRIGAVLVCEDDRLAGIFTERDVLTRVLDEARDPTATTVADVMTDRVVVVAPSTTVEEAMAVVTDKRCRHLPVMEDGRLQGLVSVGDLIRWVISKQEFEIQNLVKYITRRYPA
jgi:CBS domain-containing protein